MDNTKLAIIIVAINIIVALIFVNWCNKKIKKYTDKDYWK
jgi:uncharacterized protein YoxC